MKSDNSRVAGEVGSVQGNDVRNPVSLDEGNQARIVDLDTLDPVCHHKLSPERVGSRHLCQHWEEPF
jgi:hypothetical protein